MQWSVAARRRRSSRSWQSSDDLDIHPSIDPSIHSKVLASACATTTLLKSLSEIVFARTVRGLNESGTEGQIERR